MFVDVLCGVSWEILVADKTMFSVDCFCEPTIIHVGLVKYHYNAAQFHLEVVSIFLDLYDCWEKVFFIIFD